MDACRGTSHIYVVDQDGVPEDDRAIAGEEPRYPNGAHVIPADIATPDGVADARSRSVMVIVIDEHGNEQWLPGSGSVEDWKWPEY